MVIPYAINTHIDEPTKGHEIGETVIPRQPVICGPGWCVEAFVNARDSVDQNITLAEKNSIGSKTSQITKYTLTHWRACHLR